MKHCMLGDPVRLCCPWQSLCPALLRLFSFLVCTSTMEAIEKRLLLPGEGRECVHILASPSVSVSYIYCCDKTPTETSEGQDDYC